MAINNSIRNAAILFLVPDDWARNPRLHRELQTLQRTNFRVLIISTRPMYVIKSRTAIPYSPTISSSYRNLTVYSLPLIVVPLASSQSNLLSRLVFAMFSAIASGLFAFQLLLLGLVLCATNDVRVIHAHNGTGPDLTGLVSNILSRATRIPYVYEVHDLIPELYGEKMKLPLNSMPIRLLDATEHIALSQSLKSIFVSESMREHALSKHGLDPAKCTVIYSSWPRDFIDSLNDQPSMTSAKGYGEFIILYVGSLESIVRGLEDLVSATTILVKTWHDKHVRLVFVGEGSMRPSLVKLAAEGGIGDIVFFAGALPRTETWKWLRLADIAVIPFRRFRSTEIAVPNKLFEYMAAGKAIVVSDLTGMREIIRDGYNGLTYRQGDAEDLASVISRLLDAKGQGGTLLRLGSRARDDFLKHYCWELQEQKLLRLYDNLLRSSTGQTSLYSLQRLTAHRSSSGIINRQSILPPNADIR